MDRSSKELITIIATIVILGISVSYLSEPLIEKTILTLLAFGIIVIVNTIAKKIAAHHFELDIEIKPWKIYQFGFRNDAHFKEPLPMFWIPIALTLISKANIWWLAITQFDIKNKPERVARRHGYYRFTEKTEWDIGMIAFFGFITTLIFGVLLILIDLSYIQYIGKLSIFYAAWSLVPISNLDGTKILFTSRILWFLMAIITAIITTLALAI